MEKNRSASENSALSPLQPVVELIQGGDPDLICRKYGLSRPQLEKMLTEYQMSRRQAAMVDAYTVSQAKRNDPCPCGSGKKYKKCCLTSHEEARKLIPQEQLQKMNERAKAKEKVEKEIKKGFELISSQEYAKAAQYVKKLLEIYPEDDRFYDILLTTLLALGDYETAFQVAGERWQIATEEKLFLHDNGYHKREGIEKDRHVHFYSPSTWLETFWVAQRARTWRGEYPVQPGSDLLKAAEGLKAANDMERFPAKQEEGFEERKAALAPVLEKLRAEGPSAIPYLLPLTYIFNWASLFVPGLLHACETDESLRLLAELAMFRYPYFSQICLESLVKSGERAIPAISAVLSENPEFDELKAALLAVLGNIPSRESFELLAKFTEHENHYLVNWACEALAKQQNPEALPYLETARERMLASSKIAGAIKEIAGTNK